jgi:hypothetical protein
MSIPILLLLLLIYLGFASGQKVRIFHQRNFTEVDDPCRDESVGAFFYHMRHLGRQPRDGLISGPIQDEEALLLYALVRTAGVRRILEIGGLGGFSARNWLSAIKCAKGIKAVYTVDIHEVPTIGVNHFAVKKDA